jgi:hypothetical protein
MKLYGLAYACRLYRGQPTAGSSPSTFREFDRAYDQMCKAMGRNADLASQAQQDSLMQFLNDWRCRIPKKNFPILKERLQNWAARWAAKPRPNADGVIRLPDADRDIRSLSDSERAQIGKSYEELLQLGAGLHFQDTAAAKTLHALRPHTLPIWDAAIKGWFIGQRGLAEQSAGQTYSDFIHHVAEEISELEEDVRRLGYSLSDIPQFVHGDCGSLVKLVDEYYWMTVTEGHALPTRTDLEQWLGWIV